GGAAGASRPRGVYRGRAGAGARRPPQHLAHDQLDVLVVHADALGPVDLLDLLDQVLLRLADALDVEQLLGVHRALGNGVARRDLLAVGDDQAGAGGHRDRVLGVVADDRDPAGVLLVLNADVAADGGQ